MKIYAIADMHLSFSTDKRMDIFGQAWKGHVDKINDNWLSLIEEDDYVLLPGDISWAKKLDEAKKDLDFIAGLPGKKILVAGNHDFWWGSTDQLNSMYENMHFLKRDSIIIGDIAIAATRGWVSPGDSFFKPEDMKPYKREVSRMSKAIDSAVRKSSGKPLREFILMTHYPPTNDKVEETGFTDIIYRSPVTRVVYGHLHGSESYKASLISSVKNPLTGKFIHFHLTSADFLDFVPARIM